MHRLLRDHADHLPERLRQMLPAMIEHGLLLSYREFAGVERAVERIAHRLSRSDRLVACLHDVRTHYDALFAGFGAFYPDVIAFATATRPVLTAQLRDDPA